MTYVRRARAPSPRRSPDVATIRKRPPVEVVKPSISVRDLGTGSAHLCVNERVPAHVAEKVARIVAEHA